MSSENKQSRQRGQLSTKGKVIRGALIAAGGGLLLTACKEPYSTPPAPTPDHSPTASPSVTPSETPTGYMAATDTPSPIPTITDTPTLLPLSSEQSILDTYAKSNSDIQSSFPAWLNLASDEGSGIGTSTQDRIQTYLLTRFSQVEAGNATIATLDRFFAQKNLPVKDLSDRSLNFDWHNGGQGLGFTTNNTDVLRDQQTLLAVQDPERTGNIRPISEQNPDGRYRADTISEARSLERTVLAYVDEYLRLAGLSTSPSTDTRIQAQRKSLFEDIIYGQLGIKAKDDGDGNWTTVNDTFDVCETYTQKTSDNMRSHQSEAVHEVHFSPDQEVMGNGKEEETDTQRDSKDSFEVTMVQDPDNNVLRVDAFDLGNPPDTVNPKLDQLFSDIYNSRVHGGRLVQCAPGATTVVISSTVGVSTRVVMPSLTPKPPVFPSSTPRPEITITQGPTQPRQPQTDTPEPGDTPVDTPDIDVPTEQTTPRPPNTDVPVSTSPFDTPVPENTSVPVVTPVAP
jgi:hypothetical protein